MIGIAVAIKAAVTTTSTTAAGGAQMATVDITAKAIQSGSNTASLQMQGMMG